MCPNMCKSIDSNYMVNWNDSILINDWELVDWKKKREKRTHDAGAMSINDSVDFSTVKYPKSETIKLGTEKNGTRTSFWKSEILPAHVSNDWLASS